MRDSAQTYVSRCRCSLTARHRGLPGPLARGCPVSSNAVTIAELWRRGQLGRPCRFPIAQFRNPPLLLALAGWAIAAVAGGTAHDVGRVVFTVGLGA
jgi:hypothetical protein